MTSADLMIIGGGLAGLMAAARAEELGADAILVDFGVPGTPGGLGGFAPFSGAKFSLAPAGSGLAPVVGGHDQLIELYRSACVEFANFGLPQFDVGEAELAGEEYNAGTDLALRRYHSILLSPAEVDKLIAALSARLRRVRIIRTSVTSLDVRSGPPFSVLFADGSRATSRSLVVATGRLGADLLLEAGVPETAGKGIDVGVRLGFADTAPLAGLRAHGPDAKFMSSGVRTFCLNSPGRIFHYPGLGYSLPGGIVAEPEWQGANVGVLCRLDDRIRNLRAFAERAPPDGAALAQRGRGTDLSWTRQARRVLGEKVIERIDGFIASLVESGLLDLPRDYDVHYPLLDWHWPVFSLPGRLGTEVPGLVAAGDASGHARGLMQAAVMGRLAAQEALG
ncbi:hypothetical protein [uncultured Sphingomonas sp.]|jgi:glycine/D-amino acid oxidase-like deaminating enzyme|uniref:hypothetical protein n=1 Tax=uncultured Sphingomonas sp. TaxID=158754 RepID=UPI0030D9EA71